MICPVCEHQQLTGSECEVCGRRLAEGAATDPGIAPLEGLEVTRFAPVDADGERVQDLETTHHLPVDVPPEAPVELDPTCAEPVDVVPEVTPGIERTHVELIGDGPTPLPAFVVCRYCRTAASPGERICARCGMRLPVFAAGQLPQVAEVQRLCSCGSPVQGPLCFACGARVGDQSG
jgi:hypothetical protein